jgi:hypothetical protein
MQIHVHVVILLFLLVFVMRPMLVFALLTMSMLKMPVDDVTPMRIWVAESALPMRLPVGPRACPYTPIGPLYGAMPHEDLPAVHFLPLPSNFVPVRVRHFPFSMHFMVPKPTNVRPFVIEMVAFPNLAFFRVPTTI